jgi:hypothetical protein
MALTRLANNDALEGPIASAGGIDLIVAAMRRHSTVADVQTHACKAVWNLCAKNATNKRLARTAGLPALMEAARRAFPGNAAVQDAVKGAIATIP